MNIRLTHLDGTLPNLALMKLSHWHKDQGDTVYFTTNPRRTLDEPDYDIVYASSVFGAHDQERTDFLENWSWHACAIIGGTGTDNLSLTVEQVLSVDTYEHYDYSIYPDYPWSIGFTSRGCRLACKFCKVPSKEGRIRFAGTIADIYRPSTERSIVLLDNDFFGQPHDQWLARCQELIDGKFKVSLTQGINARLITDEEAHWLSLLNYYDIRMKNRRIYTAWDNKRDEKIFITGVKRLIDAGIPSAHIIVYMLIGFDPDETIADRMYRFQRIVDMGMIPWPMVYNKQPKPYSRGIPNIDELNDFQRWVAGGYYKTVSWDEVVALGKVPKARPPKNRIGPLVRDIKSHVSPY